MWTGVREEGCGPLRSLGPKDTYPSKDPIDGNLCRLRNNIAMTPQTKTQGTPLSSPEHHLHRDPKTNNLWT
ncbi:MAG: hypothetical protein JJT76_09620 [Clostridiaceae bacterium]|nr:hypothetical protein [Clostridiaceae bacterium]